MFDVSKYLRVNDVQHIMYKIMKTFHNQLDAPPATIQALRKTSEYWKTSLTL